MKSNFSLFFVLLMSFILCLNFSSVSFGETKTMICSCWLTAYDCGIKNAGKDSSEYKTGYNWCRKHGAQSGKSWITGWQAGRDTAKGENVIPRNCNSFFTSK